MYRHLESCTFNKKDAMKPFVANFEESLFFIFWSVVFFLEKKTLLAAWHKVFDIVQGCDKQQILQGMICEQKEWKQISKAFYFSSILTRTSRELLWATTDSKSNKLITKQTNASGANSGKTPALIFWKCGLHVVTQNGRNRHIALENSLYISRAM